jgi:hypothetical protein
MIQKGKRAVMLLIGIVAVSAIVALPVMAQGSAAKGISPAAKELKVRESRTIGRANQEIDRRIQKLNALNARFQEVKKLSDSDKSSLGNTIQNQIQSLNQLKLKIDGDTSTTSLREDVQSIVKSYRIYALIVPQSALMAAADRALTIVDMMNSLAQKLQERITAEISAGKDASVFQSLISDFNAKIADAKTQAQEAINKVSGLQPDNGDKTVMASNTQAMKDARGMIQKAQQDFVAARKDAGQIVKDLKQMGNTKLENTTSTATSS